MARIKTSSTPVIRSSTEGRPQWPGWWFGPSGEEGLFNSPEEVPEGWRNRPFPPEHSVGPTSGTKLNKDKMKQLLKSKGVKLDPRWTSAYMKQLLSES